MNQNPFSFLALFALMALGSLLGNPYQSMRHWQRMVTRYHIALIISYFYWCRWDQVRIWQIGLEALPLLISQIGVIILFPIVDLGFLSPRMFYGTFLLFQTLLFPKRVLKKNSVIVFVTRYYACRFLDICIYVYFKNVV